MPTHPPTATTPANITATPPVPNATRIQPKNVRGTLLSPPGLRALLRSSGLTHNEFRLKLSDELKGMIVLKPDAFNQLTHEGFKDAGDILKTLGETSSDTSIQNERNNVSEVLKEILKPTEEFNLAKDAYKSGIESVKKTLANQKAPNQIDGILSEIKNYSDMALEALKAQHTKEKQNLDQKLIAPEFLNSISKALEHDDTDTTKLDAAKKSLKDGLEASQKKQLEEFNKTTQESLNSVHKAKQAADTEMMLLIHLYERTRMRKDMKNLFKKNGDDADTTTITAEGDDGKVAINLANLARIKKGAAYGILSGKDITKVEGSNNFTLELNSRAWNSLYYLFGNVKDDLLLMAHAVRATPPGSETLKFTITMENPRIANIRARQAYEAGIKAGFPPDKITIELNGQLLTFGGKEKDSKSIKDFIFAEHPNKYARLQNAAPQYQAEYKKLQEEINTYSNPTPAAKAAVRAVRTKHHAPPLLIPSPDTPLPTSQQEVSGGMTPTR